MSAAVQGILVDLGAEEKINADLREQLDRAAVKAREAIQARKLANDEVDASNLRIERLTDALHALGYKLDENGDLRETRS